MRHLPRLHGLLLAIGVIIAGALYGGLRSNDEGRLLAMTTQLTRMMQIDAEIRQEMLGARTGLTPTYDGLAEVVQERRHALDRLEARIDAGQSSETERPSFDRLRVEVAKDDQLLEDFKRHNTVRRNAVQYLPRAAERVHRHRAVRRADLERRVRDLLEVTLALESTDLTQASVRQAELIDELEPLMGDLPGSAREDALFFMSHVKRIRSSRHEMAGILRASGERSVEQVGGELARTVVSALQAEVLRADLLRQALFGWSVILLLGVVWALYRLRRANDELEGKVAERTAALACTLTNLEDARDAAERESVAKSQFLATMSHEIRTPLNGVLGMAHLLHTTRLDPDQQLFVDTIAGSGEALLGVINDILDFSKIEAGSLVLEETPFSLRDTIDQVAAILGPRAYERELELACIVEGRVPDAVIGDPLRLKQVLTNLLYNAIKFTEDGGVTLHVSHFLADGQVVLDFAVHDTGIGIPEERIEVLFESFSQAESSTTREFGGTGLGLAISKRLVEAMGGEISVRSTVGEGSTFRFRAILGVADEPAAAPGAVPPMRVFDPSPRGARALIEAWRGLAGRAQAVDSLKTLDLPPDALLLVRYPVQAKEAPALARLVAQAPDRVIGVDLITDREGRDTSPIRHWLHLPIARRQIRRLLGDLRSTRSQAAENRPPTTVDPLIEGRSVLVVEDNPVNQLLMRRMLGRLGAECEIAEHGEEALRRLAEHRFELVLMDCQMPVMDGFETTARIRGGSGDHASVPIVALTANAMAGDRERCLNAGMDDYLAKPINAVALQTTLRKWLAPDPVA